MTRVEVVAAVALGLLLLWLVLGPLYRPAASAAGPLEPEEPEETPRGAALAALRELEFDRETGKLSDADYAALKSRYTAEAVAALRADASGDAESYVAMRRRVLDGTAVACPTCGPRPEPDAAFCSACGARIAA